MNLNEMLYLTVLAERKSYSQAAEVLHISRQGVMNALRRAENELGNVLFVKNDNLMELTPFGQIAIRKFKSILLEYESLSPRPGDQKDEISVLVISVSRLIFPVIFPEFPALVSKYSEEHPDTYIYWVCEDNANVFESCQTGMANAGIVISLDSTNRNLPDVILRRPVNVCMPKAHPLANKYKVSIPEICQYGVSGPDIPTSGYKETGYLHLIANKGYHPCRTEIEAFDHVYSKQHLSLFCPPEPLLERLGLKTTPLASKVEWRLRFIAPEKEFYGEKLTDFMDYIIQAAKKKF